MIEDEIMKELRAIKDQIAEEIGNDMDERCRQLQEIERKSGVRVIDLSGKHRHRVDLVDT